VNTVGFGTRRNKEISHTPRHRQPDNHRLVPSS
jgi:hypothetical protein